MKAKHVVGNGRITVKVVKRRRQKSIETEKAKGVILELKVVLT